MNKYFYLFVALVTLGLSSCSKDEQNVIKEDGTPTTLSLKLSTSGAVSTKATGVPTGTGIVGDAEGTINRITVGVFKCGTSATIKDSDPVDVIYETTSLGTATSGKYTIAGIPVTKGERSVIVIANAPAGYFSGAATRKQFLEQSINLNETTKAAGTGSVTSVQASNNLPMVGNPSVVVNTTTTTLASAELIRLVARIAITDVTVSLTGAYSNSSFTPTEIFLSNAKTLSDWIATTPTTTSNGEIGGANYLDYLGSGTTGFVKPDGVTKKDYFFYTFPNDATSPTKLVIKGVFKMNSGDVTGTTVYYPIIINRPVFAGAYSGGDGSKTIKANTAYSLTAMITGIGITDVTKDIDPVNLSVEVSVKDWTTVAQSAIFN